MAFVDHLNAGTLLVFGSAAALTAITGRECTNNKAERLDLAEHGACIRAVLEGGWLWATAREDGNIARCMFMAGGVEIIWLSPINEGVILVTAEELGREENPNVFMVNLIDAVLGE